MQDAADVIMEDTFHMHAPANDRIVPPQAGRTFSFSQSPRPIESRGPRPASFAGMMQNVDPKELPDVHQSVSAAMSPELPGILSGIGQGNGDASAHPQHDLTLGPVHEKSAKSRGKQPVSQQWADLHVPVPPGDPSHELCCATRLPIPTDPAAFTFKPSVPHAPVPSEGARDERTTHAHRRSERLLRPRPAAQQPAAEPSSAQRRTAIDLTAQDTSERVTEGPPQTRAAPASTARDLTRPNPLAAITAQNFTYPQTNPSRHLRRSPLPPPPATAPTQPATRTNPSAPPAGIPSGYLENTFPSTPSGYRFVAGQGFVCQVCGTAVKRPQRHKFVGRWCEARMVEEARR